MTHGYAAEDRAGTVEVRAELNERALMIVVENGARAYDPYARRPDGRDLAAEDREPGGLGLFLAMRNVDEFVYERVADRNRHTLVVLRRKT